MKNNIFLFVLVFSLFFCASVFSDTFYITKSGNDDNSGAGWNDAFLTITKAMDSVTSGDAVWVAEGVYIEDSRVEIGEGVTLYGGFSGSENDISNRDFLLHATVIDGDSNHQGVYNYGIIDGFHIKNCATGSSGAGIYNNTGTVRNCDIYYNNSRSSSGGGIYNKQGKVEDCSIHENVVLDTNDGKGGGIYNFGGEVIRCRIFGNFSQYNEGGGIYNDYGDVTNCLVFKNNAYSNGGGIQTKMGTVTNCTVYGNSAGYFGGGIYSWGLDEGATITNCISWNNTNGDIDGDMNTISFSCFGNAEGNNNISANPLFQDSSENMFNLDLSLKNGSPCIDTGDMMKAPEDDIENNSRPGSDNKVCMGAYESPADFKHSSPKPGIRRYVSKYGNNSDGTSWQNAFNSIKDAIGVKGDNYCEIWIARGNYLEGEEINVPQIVSLYGGFYGNETNLFERDMEKYKTIINGNNSHRCVRNNGLIDGLYVTKGFVENYGAGIFNTGKVAGCIIHDNKVEYEFSYFNVLKINQGLSLFNKGGGGIYNYGGSVSFSTLYQNTSSYDSMFGNRGGGGILNLSGGSISYCTLYDNTSIDYGGGISNDNGNVTGCILYENSSNDGAGIYQWKGNVVNSTLYKNSASSGGGIYNRVAGFISNTISWGNESGDIQGNTENVSFSCFGEAGDLNNNINANPEFVNVSGLEDSWDFHLQPGSPCINTGTDQNAAEKDPDGTLRPQGIGFDMGAYEYPFPDSAKFISQSVPDTMIVGKDYTVFIEMKNIGSVTWDESSGHYLGDCITTDTLWNVDNIIPSQTVAPDKKTSFTFTVTAPDSGGIYDFQWRMFKEPGKQWFGDKSPLMEIEVWEFLPGDIDMDGLLTLQDCDILSDILLGKLPLSSEEMNYADASQDGVIDVCDLITILLNLDE